MYGKTVVQPGTTGYAGPIYGPEISGFRYYGTVWETNPDTGSGWTDGDITSLQIGNYATTASGTGILEALPP